MKKIILFSFCSLLLTCACSEKEIDDTKTGIQAAAVYKKVDVSSLPAAEDNCGELYEMFADCKPYNCKISVKLSSGEETATLFSIKGIENRRCVYAQQITAPGRSSNLECRLNRENGAVLQEYFKKYFGKTSERRNASGTHTADPFLRLIKEGACVSAV
ncbi:MAG: hypothetical protein LBG16_00610 [Elusimicrobiota bacterium]|jgi:hypothetical protein|nr:hypothetical protein [Elusimicrobiota bacterium]